VVANEVGRLNALRQYRILDTDPEQAFDDLTLIASQICRTPIALVSLAVLVHQADQGYRSLTQTEAPNLCPGSRSEAGPPAFRARWL
jgi:hypothetical protein